MQSIWSIVVVAGPALLIAAIIWATLRNRQQSTPESEALTERTTKTQREAQAAEPKEVDGPLG